MRLAGLRGPMLVNLWAQWCEPCRAEAAHLSAFASTQKKVAVLGIDYSDPQPALAIEFAQLTGMTYPHLADEEHQLKGPLGVAGIPYTLLIDAAGKIVARHPGPVHLAGERAAVGGRRAGRMSVPGAGASCARPRRASRVPTPWSSSRERGRRRAPGAPRC